MSRSCPGRCAGGGGSFGVVTAIEFAVYVVKERYAGAMLFPCERSAELLRTWSAMLPSLPEQMTTWAALLHAPDLPFAPRELRGHSFAAVDLHGFLGLDEVVRAGYQANPVAFKVTGDFDDEQRLPAAGEAESSLAPTPATASARRVFNG